MCRRSTAIWAFLLLSAGAIAQVPPEPEELPFPFGEEEEEAVTEAPEAPAGPDPAAEDYRQALELQRKGRYLKAQRAFRKILEEHPETRLRADIENRSGDNAYLGSDVLHQGGPSVRRIDVTVMGDGFTIEEPDQAQQEKWAKLCLDVLWSEPVFDVYRDYFNFHFVRLASLEEGVDPNLSPEERQKIEERNKRRTRKRKIDFKTALECRAAGPQGQVMADRRLVMKWMRVAAKDEPGCDDDGLAIAFARFGILGMGGGGIANVGRPDKSVTVHEFGHAFVGLLDEYTNNPMTPQWEISAPNASMTSDPEKVPWAHFLKRRVPGVGVYEGGATFQKGVWRPARTCAMNSAGAMGYCPVCREAAVLRIYAYVSPIDAYEPDPGTELQVSEGSDRTLVVVPMAPKKHALEVTWYVEPIAADAAGPEAAVEEPRDQEGYGRRRIREALFGRFMGGRRARADRTHLAAPPAGEASTLGTRRKVKGTFEHTFPVGRLRAGRYRVTVQVRDETKWVLADPTRLLEERLTWWVTVAPRR